MLKSRHHALLLLLCGALSSVAPTAAAEAAAAPMTSTGHWQSLEQFLQQADDRLPVGEDAARGPLLPSLGSPQSVTPVLAPLTIKPVEFAALPPLFERPKPAPPMPAKLLSTDKKVLPQLVASVEKPVPPAKDAACAPPEMSKRAKNFASDSATLEALQQAVKELRLDERLDFMPPAKISAPTATIQK